MRYTFTFGAGVLAIMAVTGAILQRSATAQQPGNQFAPAQAGAGAGFEFPRDVHGDYFKADEASQLSAQDSQLAAEAESLAKQLADATDEKQQADLKEKLHDTLSRQFDAQQKVRELEVARIEAKVTKLRDTITKRHEARRTIIDKRLDQLLREAEGLGWNSPAAAGGWGRVYGPQLNSADAAPAGAGRPGVIFTTPRGR